MKKSICIIVVMLIFSFFGPAGTAKKKKIRNNDIYFVGMNINILLEDFIRDTFCVAKSQQFKGVSGGVYSYKIRMLSGRHSSKKVAGCFKNWLKPCQNTFNQNPKSLNFAAKGTLFLTVLFGSMFTFSDVVLAQGHSGGTNNWWFGGKNCTYVNPNRVECISDQKRPWCFWRGLGLDVNEVRVMPGTCL